MYLAHKAEMVFSCRTCLHVRSSSGSQGLLVEYQEVCSGCTGFYSYYQFHMQLERGP
jgi:hypothetical protein